MTSFFKRKVPLRMQLDQCKEHQGVTWFSNVFRGRTCMILIFLIQWVFSYMSVGRERQIESKEFYSQVN